MSPSGARRQNAAMSEIGARFEKAAAWVTGLDEWLDPDEWYRSRRAVHGGD